MQKTDTDIDAWQRSRLRPVMVSEALLECLEQEK